MQPRSPTPTRSSPRAGCARNWRTSAAPEVPSRAVPARVAIAVLCALAVLAPAAAAAPAPEPFGTNDFGGFHDILPPGTNGTANAAQLTAFLTVGQRPEHNATQLPMYGGL